MADNFRRFSTWHEDYGPCLWVDKDFNETHEVYFGCPLSSDWPFGKRQEEKDEIWWLKLPNKDFKNADSPGE